MIIVNKEIERLNEFPESLSRFEKTIPHGEAHNIYLIQTHDMNGNLTGEAYGKNLLTDNGLYKLNTNSYYLYMWVGDSDQEPTLDKCAINGNCIFANSMTVINEDRAVLPMTFDSETRLMSSRARIRQDYYDYNPALKSGAVSEDYYIREFGIGNSQTDLYYHSNVYDSEGNKSYIIKRPNERLTITTYIGASINVDLINQLYDKQIFMFVEPRFLTYERQLYGDYAYISMLPIRDSVMRYHNNMGWGYDKYPETSTYTSYLFPSTLPTDHTISATINGPNYLYEYKYDYLSACGYSHNGSICKETSIFSTTFFALTFDKSPEPEELSTDWAHTDKAGSNYFQSIFGRESYNHYSGSKRDKYGYGELPCTNFTITDLSMYNHLTKEWDIPLEYENSDYDWAHQYHTFCHTIGSLYTTFNGKNITAYVFINPRTDIGIKSFNASSITLYATDEYWDTSTWELISDIKNIPTGVDENGNPALGNKRYYVQTSGTLQALYPTHDCPKHRLIPRKESYNIAPNLIPVKSEPFKYHLAKPLSSDEMGWFATYSQIIYPDLEDGVKTFDLSYNQPPTVNYTADNNIGYRELRWMTADGKKILMGFCSTSSVDYDNAIGGSKHMTYRPKLYNFQNFRIIDVSNPAVDELPYQDITQVFGDGRFRSYDQAPHVSWCDEGFLCVQDRYVNDFAIVDISGGEDGTHEYTSYVIQNAQWCQGLNRSHNCFYLDTSNTTESKTFNVFDMRTKEVIDTFTLPTNLTWTINGTFGWREFLYVKATSNSNETSIFFYNLNDKQLIQINEGWGAGSWFDGSYMYNGNYREEMSVDEVYILNQPYSDSIYSTFYITSNAPEKINYFVKNNSSNISDYARYNGKLKGMLKYSQDGKQLFYSCIGNKGQSFVQGGYTSYCRALLFDMGHIIDNGGIERFNGDDMIKTYTLSSSEYYSVGYTCLYKDGLIVKRYNTFDINWYPVESIIPKKMTGTTTTINAYNDPIRVQGKTFSIKLTNDMSQVLAISDNNTVSESDTESSDTSG